MKRQPELEIFLSSFGPKSKVLEATDEILVVSWEHIK